MSAAIFKFLANVLGISRLQSNVSPLESQQNSGANMITKGTLVRARPNSINRVNKLDAFGLEDGDMGIVVNLKTIMPILEPQYEVYWQKIGKKVWFGNDELEIAKVEEEAAS